MTAGQAGRSVPSMSTALSSQRRNAGAACVAGAALTVAGAAVLAYAQATTSVAKDLYSWPLHRDGAIVFALFAALAHLLMLIGLVGLLRSGVAGRSRGAVLGLQTAIAGMALLFVSEFGSMLLAGSHESAPLGSVVDASFALASILLTVGLLAAGAGTVRSGNWSGWRRYTPLACGALLLIVVAIQFTSILWLGVAMFAVGFAALGLALATDPAARPALEAA